MNHEYIIPVTSSFVIITRMKPIRTLPPDYVEVGTLDLGKNKRALILVNLLGLALMFIFGALFYCLLEVIRPGALYQALMTIRINLIQALLVTLILLAALAVMLIGHEAIHGFFFRVFSQTRPKFEFKGWYACAGLPGWYLPRGKYLITALSSFVVITLIGFLLLAFVPVSWILFILTMMIANASGSVGDLVVAVWLLCQPRGSFAQDRGDSVTLYKPASQKTGSTL